MRDIKYEDIDFCFCIYLIYFFVGIWENNFIMIKRKELDDYKGFNDLKKR